MFSCISDYLTKYLKFFFVELTYPVLYKSIAGTINASPVTLTKVLMVAFG